MFVQMKAVGKAALFVVFVAGYGIVETAFARKDATPQAQEKTISGQVRAKSAASVIVGGSAKTGEFIRSNQNGIAPSQPDFQNSVQARTFASSGK